MTDEVRQESLWTAMMMFADDAVVSGESREHVGETRGKFCPDSIATFKSRPSEGMAQI